MKILFADIFSVAAVGVWIGGMFTTASVVDWVTGEDRVYNGTWNGSYLTHLAGQECVQTRLTDVEPVGLWTLAACDTPAIYVCEKDMS